MGCKLAVGDEGLGWLVCRSLPVLTFCNDCLWLKAQTLQQGKDPWEDNTPSCRVYYTMVRISSSAHSIDQISGTMEADIAGKYGPGIGWESSELCPCPLPSSLKVGGPSSLWTSGMRGTTKAG